MPLMGRLVVFLYNLVMLLIAGMIVAMSLGWSAPSDFLNAAASTPGNRLILGAFGLLLAIIALMLMSWGLKSSGNVKTILVESAGAGDISISVPAIKAIIMKAIKQVPGIKEMKPSVNQSADGLVVKLHTMVIPEHNVPALSQALQTVVKDQLEKVGGLQVAKIQVLIDEFSQEAK